MATSQHWRHASGAEGTSCPSIYCKKRIIVWTSPRRSKVEKTETSHLFRLLSRSRLLLLDPPPHTLIPSSSLPSSTPHATTIRRSEVGKVAGSFGYHFCSSHKNFSIYPQRTCTGGRLGDIQRDAHFPRDVRTGIKYAGGNGIPPLHFFTMPNKWMSFLHFRILS